MADKRSSTTFEFSEGRTPKKDNQVQESNDFVLQDDEADRHDIVHPNVQIDPPSEPVVSKTLEGQSEELPEGTVLERSVPEEIRDASSIAFEATEQVSDPYDPKSDSDNSILENAAQLATATVSSNGIELPSDKAYATSGPGSKNQVPQAAEKDEPTQVVDSVESTDPDINNPPTTPILTGDSVDENLAAGTLVGTVSATDPDAGDSWTYGITDASGNFTIDPNSGEIRTTGSLDHEAQDSYT
ncbi:MAG: cadherin repeat domain-containing protein, partial [Methyloligellaceae bacterium]